jgi:hypothetical protein
MKGLHLILILTLSVAVLGAKKAEKKTTFETSTEAFEGQKKSILTIPNAKGLEIHISGEIHNSETLRIYEYNQKEQGQEIFKGQGVLKLKHPLIVIDNEILVTLNAKDKTTRKGATVTISELETEKFLEYVRKDILNTFNKLETGEHIEKIDQNIKESHEILEKLPSQNNKQVSDSLRTLVEKYRLISSQKKTLSQTHQSLQKNLQNLAKKSKKWSKHLSSSVQKKSEIEKELIKQQSDRWLEGAKDFKELSDQIGLYNKTLNELFKTLDENAQIFYETANNIDLNMNPLSKVLEKLVDSKETLQTLNQHWQLIDKLKENIKKNGFW